METWKEKAYEYNSIPGKIAKENEEMCKTEFKNLTRQRNDLIKIAKNKWHPIPEMSLNDLIFSKISSISHDEER